MFDACQKYVMSYINKKAPVGKDSVNLVIKSFEYFQIQLSILCYIHVIVNMCWKFCVVYLVFANNETFCKNLC